MYHTETIHPYKLLVLAKQLKIDNRLLIKDDKLPYLSDAFKERETFYVDAGSRNERISEDYYFIKLAVLYRKVSNQLVKERILHPYIHVPENNETKTLPPIHVGKGGERARQAATYIVELATLLGIVQKYEENHTLMLMKHGPLFQLLSEYFSHVYTIQRDEAVKLLRYAGLDSDEANKLAEESSPCAHGSNSIYKDRNKVQLGVLILRILTRLIDGAKKGKFAISGIVENVSRSRLLIPVILSIAITKANEEARINNRELNGSTFADWAAIKVNEYLFSLNSELVNNCLCIDHNRFSSIVENKDEWKFFIERIEEVLKHRFNKNLSDATSEEIEAATAWSGALPDINDAELIYLMYYLSEDHSLYPGTIAIPHLARLKILEYYLNKYKNIFKCSLSEEELKNTIDLLKNILFKYIAPIKPPRCKDLNNSFLKPCRLSSIYKIPPPFRIESVNGMPYEYTILSEVLFSSKLVIYGYPSQILIVDQHSRLSLSDAYAFKELIEKISTRLQPYSMFLHDWENRLTLV